MLLVFLTLKMIFLADAVLHVLIDAQADCRLLSHN